mgnify:CR=1 FL=1
MEFEKLQAIIADVLNVPKDDITPETTFVDDLGADSLDIFRSLWELRKSSILRSTMKKQKRSQLCRMQLSR